MPGMVNMGKIKSLLAEDELGQMGSEGIRNDKK
jgi:hypothetical protein